MNMKYFKEGNQKGEWFVILKERENDLCRTPAQIAIYMAIKSFCGNGKLKRGLSLREISKRSKYSVGWTKSIIEELKTQGLVFTHGTETRRGGNVEVFSVGTDKESQSVPPARESVPTVGRSVPEIGINNLQSNKVIKEDAKNSSFKRNSLPESKSMAEVKIDWAELSKLSEEARARDMNGGRNA